MVRYMRPIFDNHTFRQMEERAIEEGEVSVFGLMEVAGQRCAERILAVVESDPSARFLVLAGMGNNGGDGLVIARYLARAGRSVRVILVEHHPSATEAHAENRAKLDELPVEVCSISASQYAIHISDNEYIIDCILGSGATRPLSGWLASLVEMVAHSGRPVLAVDQPSGSMDPVLEMNGVVVQADVTFVLEVPRLAMFYPETGVAFGKWVVIPIGLPLVSVEDDTCPTNLVEERDVQALLLPKSKFSHKGNYGHAFLVAGGAGCHGAALLAGMGCARSGAGLITLHGSMETLHPVMVALPDLMTVLDDGVRDDIQHLDLHRYTAIGVGPGLGRSKRTTSLVRHLLMTWAGPLVLDADALNAMADDRTLLSMLGRHVVLTPHPKEMDRLLGIKSASSYDRHLRTTEFAVKHDCTVVLKGAYTAICTADGKTYFNPTGNPGMAKGGSGDVLTGLLVGVLAQGYEVLNSSMLSVYLHGLAGDFAAARFGQDAMRPSDLVDHLPEAWQQIRRG